jgi:hypothetical protein
VPIRKRLIQPARPTRAPAWLAVEELAQIEVTSEDREHPIDSALIGDRGSGWRASGPGEQLIRLIFDEPRAIRLIHLVFAEADQERSHEFILQWSSDRGRTYQPIVRQQFSFSPSGATQEVEDYEVDLNGVTDLQLHIIPDISRRPVVASLRELRLR